MWIIFRIKISDIVKTWQLFWLATKFTKYFVIKLLWRRNKFWTSPRWRGANVEVAHYPIIPTLRSKCPPILERWRFQSGTLLTMSFAVERSKWEMWLLINFDIWKDAPENRFSFGEEEAICRRIRCAEILITLRPDRIFKILQWVYHYRSNPLSFQHFAKILKGVVER